MGGTLKRGTRRLVSEGAVVVAFKRSHNEKKEAGTIVEDHRRVKPETDSAPLL